MKLIKPRMVYILLAAMTMLMLAPMATAQETVTLQILHASDLEGGVAAIDDAPNFAAVVEGLENDAAANGYESILLSAGDNYLPGPFFNAAGDRSMRDIFSAAGDVYFGKDEGSFTNLREGSGRLDINVMNVIGFDASAMGNHEFDPGTNAMSDIIGTDVRGETLDDARYLGPQFPYLSANLDFSTDGNLADLATTEILPNTAFQSSPDDLANAGAAPKIAPATTIELSNGEQVGVIGATTQLVAAISSPGGVSLLSGGQNDMAAMAEIIQPIVDQMTADGINKIIIVSHLQQLALEEELATLLDGVDVIVAGGSDSLLADETDVLRAGDEADREYPVVTADAAGSPTLIVSTDGQYSYVGRLVVQFDAAGMVVLDSLDAEVSGAYATTEDGVAAVWGDDDAFADGSKAAQVAFLTSAVVDIVSAKDGEVYGQTAVFLEGRRAFVRTEETNLGNLTADANLAEARAIDETVEVSFKNGGGIRSAIGTIDGETGEYGVTAANEDAGKDAGGISQLDLEGTLRFNNSLTMLTLTTEELLVILEHAVAGTAEGRTPGQFPQIGGLAFSFDPTATPIELGDNGDGGTSGEVVTPGERVKSVALIDGAGNVIETLVENGVVLVSRDIRVVTLNFIAGGGDNYPFDDYGRDVVETEIGEQEAMANYLAANFADEAYAMADTPAAEDSRIQNLAVRQDGLAGDASAGDDIVTSDNTGPTGPYVVQPGDTLGSIAVEVYGSFARWQDIYSVNEDTIENPSRIYPGQVLQLP